MLRFQHQHGCQLACAAACRTARLQRRHIADPPASASSRRGEAVVAYKEAGPEARAVGRVHSYTRPLLEVDGVVVLQTCNTVVGSRQNV